MNIYKTSVEFFNSLGEGNTFTSKQFHYHMRQLGYKDSYQTNYRINTYRTYLKRVGFLTKVKQGLWRVNHIIPDWVSLKMVEKAIGYGCCYTDSQKIEAKFDEYFSSKQFESGTKVYITEANCFGLDNKAGEEVIIRSKYQVSGDYAIIYSITRPDLPPSRTEGWICPHLYLSKTNIQEKVSPDQKNSVDLQSTKQHKKTTVMATKNTFKATAAFIRKCHSESCPAWKEKLESNFPQVFEKVCDTTRKVKPGDWVVHTHPSGSSTTMIVASVDANRCALICMQNGNRWSDPVAVDNVTSITPEEFTKLISLSSKSEWTFEDGTEVFSTKGAYLLDDCITVNVPLSLIKEAYQAAPSTQLKDSIKREFPKAFGIEYVKLIDEYSLDSHQEVNFSTRSKNIDGVNFIVGRGIAPNEELMNACIGVSTLDVEVEVIKEAYWTWIAFKKK